MPENALCGKVVIYVSYAAAAPIVAQAINDAVLAHAGGTLRAVAYLGRLSDADRRAALSDWSAQAGARVLVSTCAFGTGMDPKHEVSLVAHIRLPPSLLDLWQEWGRAGRKGSAAWCILCLDPRFVTQTLRFAADQPPALRGELVQELVEVIALAMLPGCRRRLLDGMISSGGRVKQCSACDVCCQDGSCGLWRAWQSAEWEATAVAETILEPLCPGVHVPAPTLTQALASPLTSAVGADAYRRLLLHLIAEGMLRVVWEAEAFRLHADLSVLRAISAGLCSVHLALPLSVCPTSSKGKAAREAALAELDQACVEKR
uniref:DNA 3'-5' helicase n=1 Tax=Haptolina ericina TaxID=156174 RepID=A0A7S3AQ68_9EUKA